MLPLHTLRAKSFFFQLNMRGSNPILCKYTMLSFAFHLNCTKFAPAMANLENLQIDLKRATAANESFDLSLDDHFFQQLEQEEISGGSIRVKCSIKQFTEDTFQLNFDIAGEVEVLCDRCLDAVRLPVAIRDNCFISYGEENEDLDIKSISPSERIYDLSWDIYELIETSLPIERKHPQGLCNKDMLRRFQIENEE